MSSAWNWLGIFIWLIIIAYLLWIIDNVHSRKKKLIKVAMNNQKHGMTSDVSKNNFEITLFEVLILIVLLIGMGKTTRGHHVKSTNSIMTAKYEPLTESQTKLSMKHPNRKIHHYYVKVKLSRARNFKQKYTYAVNGKKHASTNGNSMIIRDRSQLNNNKNLSYVTNQLLHKKSIWKSLNQDRPGIVTLTTRFKNSPANGLGLHAGQKKFSYTIVKIPRKYGQKSIYLSTKKLKKKAKAKVPKG